eukprot:TRINITY_DN1028_c0_g1_i2.p1 TRINITY_DN1028_c0_g1~~TRINITY_DN1028_c0_g1_i2.p1  ORF type:complete len:105 (+),score=30.09 TRINITY_DN1028_c0_g1_i2:81-395(+)
MEEDKKILKRSIEESKKTDEKDDEEVSGRELQNWWKKQQFIEVDRDYLLFCQPMLYYVEEPQLAIPEKFLVDFKYYGENDIDVEETMEEPEGPIKGIDGDELDY